TWTRDLKLGSSGADVKALQMILNEDVSTQVSAGGPGSHGGETTLFGGKTKVAVIAFQEKYRDELLAPLHLSKGTGIVGPATRAKLNRLCVSASASISSTANVTA